MNELSDGNIDKENMDLQGQEVAEMDEYMDADFDAMDLGVY